MEKIWVDSEKTGQSVFSISEQISLRRIGGIELMTRVNKRLLMLIAVSAAIVMAISGCRNAESSSSAMGGDPVEAQRIVSLAPATTEILVAIGCADKLVAVDSYSQALEGVPQDIACFDMLQPDAEQLITLAPDVMIINSMSAYEAEGQFKTLRDSGINILELPTATTLEEIKNDIVRVGEAVGKKADAEALVDTMQKEIESIVENRKLIETPRTVYFEISPAPALYSFGSGVYLNEVLELIGARNILADEEGWLSISAEEIVARNPDVILTNVNYIDEPLKELAERAGWGDVAAVKAGRIYQIDNNASSLPNQNVITAIHQIAEAVYPEYYAAD